MATSTDLRAAIEEIQDALPAGAGAGAGAEGLGREELGEDYQRQALERFARRIGTVPWWVISSAAHMVIFLLIAVLAVATKPPPPDVYIAGPHERMPPPKIYERPDRREVFSTDTTRKEWKEDINRPPAKPDTPVDVSQTLSDVDKPSRVGTPEAISDIPTGDTLCVAKIGHGETGASLPWGFGRTPGGRKNAVGGGPDGGSVATESSVTAALEWLARHQEPDGSWDPVKHGAEHGSNVRYRVGCTGLALLAFLGHGETERSGKYANVVRTAQQWLMKQQKPGGGIFEKERGGSSVSAGYNHAIAGLALAESFGMAGNPEVGRAAQRAVDYSIGVHQADGYSGWRYDPKEPGDLSVTGWFVMQLKSARMVGLTVDGKGLNGGSAFVDKVFDAEGRGRYMEGRSPTSSMTAVAMVCRQFTGAQGDDPSLVKAAGHLLKDQPDWKKAGANGGGDGDKGMYYWYYGTLGMFQMGRRHGWIEWNRTLKPVLVDNQRRGGDEDGSWDPQSWIDQYGGRVFTTAMGALTLEVYYRYPAMCNR